MSDGRTHHDWCWREHHDCAVAEVERLRAIMEHLQEDAGPGSCADFAARHDEMIAQARAEEREACAQVAETVKEPCTPNCAACLEAPRRIAADDLGQLRGRRLLMEIDLICPYCKDVTYIEWDPDYHFSDYEYECGECTCVFTIDVEFDISVTPKRIDDVINEGPHRPACPVDITGECTCWD